MDIREILTQLQAGSSDRQISRDLNLARQTVKRAARRQRSRQRRHALGGSGAYTRHPLRRQVNLLQKWQLSNQTTH